MITNVLEFLEASCARYPDKIAVADDKQQLTYKELSDLSDKIGAALIPYVEQNSPVPVFMDKSCMALAVFLGVVKAGCFYCMMDTSQPADRLNHILATLEAKVMIINEKSAKKQAKLDFTGMVIPVESHIDDVIDEGDRLAMAERREQAIDIDPLYAIFTSGSTGVPKGVVVNHRSTIDFITNFTEIFSITEDDIIGNQAPFDFDVSVKDIYSSLYKGATLQVIPKSYFSFPTKLLDYLDERNVTTLVWAVSALCIITTLKGFDYKRPHAINKVIFSGEVMPIKHLNAWREVYPNAMFVNVYGPTEITCNCTYYIVDREFALDEKLPLGKTFPNERVFLLDEEDKPVTANTPGKLGEICVSGTAVTLGYYNNEERTNIAFVQNPLNPHFNEVIYRTGDLGEFDENGDLFYTTRKDFQIKLNGHRIELTEVELAINAVEGISRSCCIFDKDNNRIVAFVEGINVDAKAIVHDLTKRIPKFMIPQEFEIKDVLPLTKNGKVDRKVLMESFLEAESLKKGE